MDVCICLAQQHSVDLVHHLVLVRQRLNPISRDIIVLHRASQVDVVAFQIFLALRLPYVGLIPPEVLGHWHLLVELVELKLVNLLRNEVDRVGMDDLRYVSRAFLAALLVEVGLNFYPSVALVEAEEVVVGRGVRTLVSDLSSLLLLLDHVIIEDLGPQDVG